MDESPPEEEGEYLVWDGIKYSVDEWYCDKWITDDSIVKYVKIE